MPYCSIRTNVSLTDERIREVGQSLSALVADRTGKPESYVMTDVAADCCLSFGGSYEPAAYVQFKSLGLADDAPRALSERICDFVTAEIGVPPIRIYIEFAAPPRHMWGFDRSTFG
jgi:hypothetical protein